MADLLFWMINNESGVYDNPFSDTQPKYRDYFNRCIDYLSGIVYFELDRNEKGTRFRTRKEDFAADKTQNDNTGFKEQEEIFTED